MKKLFLCLLAAATVFAFGCERKVDEAVMAKDAVRELLIGQNKMIIKHGSEELKAAMATPEGLQATDQLRAQFGEFIEFVEEPVKNRFGVYDLWLVTAKCEKQVCKFNVAFDADGKIAGITMAP